MGNARLTTARPTRALTAGVAACLLLLQSFAIILSPMGRAAFLHGGGDAAVAAASELCNAGSHDSGEAPAPRHHDHRHCALCLAGNRDLSLETAVFSIVAAVLLTPPRSEAAPAWFRRAEPRPSSSAWASSSPPRAPPSFS